MPQTYIYTVYSDYPSATGGKVIAVCEEAQETDFQAIAKQNAVQYGAPITAFITEYGQDHVDLRFFNAQKEKGDSDSGAIVALAHLRERGEVAENVQLNMQEVMQARLQKGMYHILQGNAKAWEVHADLDHVCEALQIDRSDLDQRYPILAASTSRPNLVVPLTAEGLRSAKPNLELVTDLNHATGTRGLIFVCLEGEISFRYTAPLKNIVEDNAASNTYATLCGYLSKVGMLEDGAQRLSVTQAVHIKKPSRLSASFTVQNGEAKDIWVGGLVTRQEVLDLTTDEEEE
ncbi:PhzF family phenazine biosynthesis protein [Deinococcus roseus]|uniref:PhzF family phenazine biosynthesis protein n=1 Tax=Deinococcus roseus TaxID=392414 RepID=A0ABQ2DCD4_9DEIO|nr:PhzF family phenazine biosynthesis protein [Deinococcus roseus]GGJ51144.1 hypothetical protein GCM10008938_41470 [Deinococcus roseus]